MNQSEILNLIKKVQDEEQDFEKRMISVSNDLNTLLGNHILTQLLQKLGPLNVVKSSRVSQLKDYNLKMLDLISHAKNIITEMVSLASEVAVDTSISNEDKELIFAEEDAILKEIQTDGPSVLVEGKQGINNTNMIISVDQNTMTILEESMHAINKEITEAQLLMSDIDKSQRAFIDEMNTLTEIIKKENN
ncbi:hypothetical protein K9M79_04270 [Candidatus Woesearchaeota archaeon]|nr:hypothetical protein [Candidatus Woesearchaeota archaeon]